MIQSSTRSAPSKELYTTCLLSVFLFMHYIVLYMCIFNYAFVDGFYTLEHFTTCPMSRGGPRSGVSSCVGWGNRLRWVPYTGRWRNKNKNKKDLGGEFICTYSGERIFFACLEFSDWVGQFKFHDSSSLIFTFTAYISNLSNREKRKCQVVLWGYIYLFCVVCFWVCSMKKSSHYNFPTLIIIIFIHFSHENSPLSDSIHMHNTYN